MESTLPLRLATAGMIGFVVGLEREWSKHTDDSHTRFAGLRTFSLIGIIGGIAGELLVQTHETAAGAFLIAVTALCVVAYVVTLRRAPTDDFDGTTQVAAIAVLGLGMLAALGEMSVAAGAGAVVVLLLGEKAHLHGLVRHIAPEELEGALQFAVLALVVLPLLPAGPFGGTLDIEPRVIWSIVLLFCALNYCGYVARRVLGANRGYGVTGLLGGLISSTAVTLQFSRHSRVEPSLAPALGIGVIGACTVLLPRVVLVSAIINPSVAVALVPRLLVIALIGVVACVGLLYRYRADLHGASSPPLVAQNPLAFGTSLRMALAFQVAISVIAVVRAKWGNPGLYAGATILGLTDVDALTVSTAQGGFPAVVAAQAIVLGITANTLLKATVSAALGHPHLRRMTVPVLFAMAIGNMVVLGVWWQ